MSEGPPVSQRSHARERKEALIHIGGTLPRWGVRYRPKSFGGKICKGGEAKKEDRVRTKGKCKLKGKICKEAKNTERGHEE
jgi:hypothetical protein